MAPTPLRAVFLDHTALLGGGEIALLNTLRFLDPAEVRPTVILFSDGPLRPELERAGIETILLPLAAKVLDTRKDSLGLFSFRKLSAGFATLRFTWRLSRLLRSLGPIVVHTNSLKSDVIGAIAARLAHRPVVCHVRDRIHPEYLPGTVVRLLRAFFRHVPSLVIANSRATLMTLTDEPASARYRIVYDGTPLTLQATPNPAAGAPATIGIVGRISLWKGQHIFLQAAQRVLATLPNTRFQIIGAPLFGEDDYHLSLLKWVADHNLADRVEFTGFRNDIPDLIARLDVLVHASIIGEPFGQVLIEGMAMGKPVVATRAGAVPEVVDDGRTGLLVPPDDPTSMAAAIIQLLHAPDLAARMGEAGAQRVAAHFTSRHAARALTAVLCDLAAQPPASSPTPAPEPAG